MSAPSNRHHRAADGIERGALARPFLARFREALAACISGAFLAAISLPLLGMMVLPSSFEPMVENRPPAPLPELAMKTLETFPGRLERWFSDRFAFRRSLIRATSLAKIRLGVSPSERVVVGRDGFLFYAGENGVPQFRRFLPFPARELREWGARLEARRAWLEARGIRYMLLIPPNKEVVYPDMMPAELTRRRAPSRLDELLGYLRRHSSVDAIDLRPALASARRRGRVYWRTDTHWNGLGAFAAYRAVADRLHEWLPSIEPIAWKDVIETHRAAPGGDLSRMLALIEELPESDLMSLRPFTL